MLNFLTTIFAFIVCMKHIANTCPVASARNGTLTFHNQRQALGVYYETLCPDSKRFIHNQLPVIIRDFSDKVQINLVPFGAAHVK